VNEEITIKQILGYKNIAVVGLSSKPERPSYGVAAYMQRHGYNIIPVNPTEEEVLGQKCYPSLTDIPSEIEIDVVDVFRRAEETPPVIDEAIARGVKAVWLQLGIANAEARQKAEAAGLLYVENKCIKIEHAYYR
jgi:predicted CoA-binding protein